MSPATWHAVDRRGLVPATGDRPRPPGAPTPAAALADTTIATWPLATVADDGRRVDLAEALGAGGRGVEALVGRLVCPPTPLADAEVAARAAATPAGPVELGVAMVNLAEGVDRAHHVDRAWLDAVEHQRSRPRRALLDAGRELQLEAALHVAMLVATEQLDPASDGDVDAHVASGALLWLLGGAVTWALSGNEPDPFGPWADLVVAGIWPVGPSDGRLVVCADPRLRRGRPSRGPARVTASQ